MSSRQDSASASNNIRHKNLVKPDKLLLLCITNKANAITKNKTNALSTFAKNIPICPKAQLNKNNITEFEN